MNNDEIRNKKVTTNVTQYFIPYLMIDTNFRKRTPMVFDPRKPNKKKF